MGSTCESTCSTNHCCSDELRDTQSAVNHIRQRQNSHRNDRKPDNKSEKYDDHCHTDWFRESISFESFQWSMSDHKNEKLLLSQPLIVIDSQNITYHTSQLTIIDNTDAKISNKKAIIELFDWTNYQNYYQNNTHIFEHHYIIPYKDIVRYENQHIYTLMYWSRQLDLNQNWSSDLTKLIVQHFLYFFVEIKTLNFVDSQSQFTINNLKPSHTYLVRMKIAFDNNVYSEHSKAIEFCTVCFDISKWYNELTDIAMCIERHLPKSSIQIMFEQLENATISDTMKSMETNQCLLKFVYCFVGFYIRFNDGNQSDIPNMKLLKPLLANVSNGIQSMFPQNQKEFVNKDYFVENVVKLFCDYAKTQNKATLLV